MGRPCRPVHSPFGAWQFIPPCLQYPSFAFFGVGPFFLLRADRPCCIFQMLFHYQSAGVAAQSEDIIPHWRQRANLWLVIVSYFLWPAAKRFSLAFDFSGGIIELWRNILRYFAHRAGHIVGIASGWGLGGDGYCI